MKKEEWGNIFGDTPEGFHNSVNSALKEISEMEEIKCQNQYLRKK